MFPTRPFSINLSVYHRIILIIKRPFKSPFITVLITLNDRKSSSPHLSCSLTAGVPNKVAAVCLFTVPFNVCECRLNGELR